MAKQLKLQHSESVVAHTASRIYAAYLASGRCSDGEENVYIKRSIREAIKLCMATDEMVISDDEVTGLGQQIL